MISRSMQGKYFGVLAVRIWPDFAQLLGVGRTTAYEIARSGEIEVLSIGRRRLVPLDAAREYVRNNSSAQVDET